MDVSELSHGDIIGTAAQSDRQEAGVSEFVDWKKYYTNQVLFLCLLVPANWTAMTCF